MELIKPQRLQPGQTIGVVAPASATNSPDETRMALECIASLGFAVKPGEHLFDRHGYFAGQDEDRAADLHHMFADEEVDGIIAVRGGYGASRLLPYLDYDLIRRHPKPLIGYSDITALLHAIHHQSGLVTFHGPVAAAKFTPYTLAEFQKILLHPIPQTEIGTPPRHKNGPGLIERENRLIRLVEGRVQGRLIGGNLSLLSHLIGTPYEPDFKDKILVLEDIGEAVYRIDRMLTQLWLAGKIDQVAGLVFGKFTDCRPNSSRLTQFSLEEVLAERCQAMGIPALAGLMIGHVDDQTTFPLGVMAELDVTAGTLTLLEPGVA